MNWRWAWLLLITSLITACGRPPAPTATATVALSPQEIATQAAEAMLAAESLHFVVERDGAPAYIDADGLLSFKRAEGDFVRPDKLRALVRLVTAFAPVEIGMIVLGEEQFATDPITGQWQLLPPEWGQLNLAVLFDPTIGVRGLLRDGLYDLKLMGQETLDGRPFYHLAARALGERVSAMTLGMIGGTDVDLEAWIGTEDYHVRRLYIVERDGEDQPTTWDLTFSQPDQQVEIQAPPIATPQR